MNDTWYNLTIPRHLNEKQKAYFWNHAQDHRLCGKNHRAGGPFDRSSPLSTSPTLRRANRIEPSLIPWPLGSPFSGTSNCRTERKACSGSAQGYCRSQEYLWDLWAAGWAWSLFSGRSTDCPWYNDTGLSESVPRILHPSYGCCGQRGTCSAFLHASTVCPWSGYGTAELDEE